MSLQSEFDLKYLDRLEEIAREEREATVQALGNVLRWKAEADHWRKLALWSVPFVAFAAVVGFLVGKVF